MHAIVKGLESDVSPKRKRGILPFRCSRYVLIIASFLMIHPAPSHAADPPPRYDIPIDLKTFPQGSAKETLQSLIKAVEAKNVGYILAHLADSEWVDARVKDYGQKFEVLLKETTGKLVDDPSAVKLLKRFEKEGNWEGDETRAQVKLKDIADKSIQFRKIGERWFTENQYKAKGK